MDINSKGKYPSLALSNFAPQKVMFDWMDCESMEGLLQSFKFSNQNIQERVCGMAGREAKKYGQLSVWQKYQKLWWKGKEYDRHGDKYQKLLDRAFTARANNTEFIDALLATGDEEITHSIGESDKNKTILTEEEFCSRLIKIRTRLRLV